MGINLTTKIVCPFLLLVGEVIGCCMSLQTSGELSDCSSNRFCNRIKRNLNGWGHGTSILQISLSLSLSPHPFQKIACVPVSRQHALTKHYLSLCTR